MTLEELIKDYTSKEAELYELIRGNGYRQAIVDVIDLICKEAPENHAIMSKILDLRLRK